MKKFNVTKIVTMMEMIALDKISIMAIIAIIQPKGILIVEEIQVISEIMIATEKTKIQNVITMEETVVIVHGLAMGIVIASIIFDLVEILMVETALKNDLKLSIF